MKATVFLNAHMVIATNERLIAMRFLLDDFGNLCLNVNKKAIPILNNVTKFKASGVNFKLTIIKINIKRKMFISFLIEADKEAILTTERKL